MNRRICCGALCVCMLLGTSPASYAATHTEIDGVQKKIVRGFVNVLTGWLEVPMQMFKGYQDDENKISGITGGFFRGLFYGTGRTAWGVVELCGFWTAAPEDNIGVGLSLDDDYAWQEGVSHDYFYPTFNEATVRPVGRKFVRGVTNGFFGVVEIPGQVGKGMKERWPDLGIMKGAWYFLSREYYGAADMVTLFFPVNEDNPGFVFDREYPWDALADVMEKPYEE